MSRVVLVHGIAQQVRGAHSLLESWYPALVDGLARAGHETVARDEVAMAFYGDLFRKPGTRAVGAPLLDASDVTGDERDFLLGWWEAAAALEPAVPGPGDRTRMRAPNVVQRALNALSHSAFFAGLAEHLLVFSARQARLYLTDPEIRARARARVTDEIGDRTRVVVAHSLGSVVAYEALHESPAARDVTLVTLGSPLGVRGLVFDRLDPRPALDRGSWPAAVTRWTNIADRGDVVALAKRLEPVFGGDLRDLLVHNGSHAHDIRPYLTAKETGDAIAEGL
ncbi:hypothetical protein Misp01_58690 [Microtetraspora sp. NBRC 13810]|uniref:hypothetical protein n=1 Tax=Microtetraspora sp. NBRC 13810 TaxID=3030990 RepID=UPI0024A4DB4B|nr:hypothetical protein [Microtetraspora sp. NBRC 13810]GLW10741.1 hypothetical protein Misp01_58690 [Microtetraspora sp. NBRC 13810]